MSVGTRHLFVDLEEVEARYNVVQCVVEATKHPGNPVLPLGDLGEWDSLQARPWEGRSVLYDAEERLFKCWYSGSDLTNDRWWALGYAVSEDGIHWEKPRLGLFEYNGNTDNNITCLDCGPVIKDPAASDPRRRYTLLAKGPLGASGVAVDQAGPEGLRRRGGGGNVVRIYHSEDGVHWNEHARIRPPEWQANAHDLAALVLDDKDPDPQRRYKLLWQITVPVATSPRREGRAKCLSYGPDLEHLGAAGVPNPILQPGDGIEHENHFLMLVPYEGIYLLLYEHGWYAPTDRGNFGRYCADIRLAASRDGLHYRRVQPHQKVIPRGTRGDWDDGFLVISDKAVVKDDTIYLYYAGLPEASPSWPKQNIRRDSGYRNSAAFPLSRMGLAILRLDGFVCLETPDRETAGWVTTRPLEPGARPEHLVLNVACTQQGRSWIEVEVLDAERDEPLPGFGRDDCVDVCRDGVRVPVQWRTGTFAAVPATRVRLRFWLHGAARLFAYFWQ